MKGVVLTGALTATIDVDLRVGSLEETVTVTGESPIVDVQSARRQQVIDGDVLQTIPTSRSYNNVLQLVPGVVAGDGQVQLRPTMLLFTAHGGNTEDGRLTLDGINTGASRGGAGVSGYIPDMQNAAEVTFTISGNLGEAETGGPQMTVVPKSGGNTFNGSFFISGLNDSMQGDNFDAKQLSVSADTGEVAPAARLPGVGRRPGKKDRMWYFFNHRAHRLGRRAAGHLREQERRRSDEVDLRARLHAAGPHRSEPQDHVAAPDDADLAEEQADGVLGRAAAVQRRGMAGHRRRPAASRNKDGWIYGGSQMNGFFGAGPNSPETGDYASTHQRCSR